MAIAEDIGYDATGRKTFRTEIESEIPGERKVEIHRSDLYDFRVYFDWSRIDPKRPAWSESHREIIPETGIAGQWKEFQRHPESFLS